MTKEELHKQYVLILSQIPKCVMGQSEVREALSRHTGMSIKELDAAFLEAQKEWGDVYGPSLNRVMQLLKAALVDAPVDSDSSPIGMFADVSRGSGVAEHVLFATAWQTKKRYIITIEEEDAD